MCGREPEDARIAGYVVVTSRGQSVILPRQGHRLAMEEGGDDPVFLARVLGVVACAPNMSALARKAGMTRAGSVPRSG